MLEQIDVPFTRDACITLYLKRDDLLHPVYGGNKLRKLKYNIQECKQQGKTGLLTCGGAYSNHILATAAYGKEQHLKTKAIIRGDELIADNPTLKDAASFGMEFVFVNREVYRTIREEPSKVYALSQSNESDYFFIPEGGTNTLAVKGIAELIEEIDIPFDYIATPCGTGATCAGLLKGLKDRTERLLIFSALKNGDYIIKAVKDLLKEEYKDHTLELFTSAYSFGGYAKMKPELRSFIQSFKEQTGVLLDPIYNGKMMYGLFAMIEEGYFKKGTVIIALHTGGVQAWRGFVEENNK